MDSVVGKYRILFATVSDLFKGSNKLRSAAILISGGEFYFVFGVILFIIPEYTGLAVHVKLVKPVAYGAGMMLALCNYWFAVYQNNKKPFIEEKTNYDYLSLFFIPVIGVVVWSLYVVF